MNRWTGWLIVCMWVASTAAFAQSNNSLAGRAPAGIYTNFLLDSISKLAYTAAYHGRAKAPHYPYPALTEAPTNDVIIKYLTILLDDPNVSGLAPMMPWSLLSRSNPGPDPYNPASGSYAWEPLNDVFIAVDTWNKANAPRTKTIQLMISPGFNSPDWLWTDIDDHAAGCVKKSSESVCTGDCDGLFATPAPAKLSFGNCGYTSIFWRVEGNPIEQIPLPMPWNPTYKTDWQNFLIALNAQIQTEPSSSAFVSIEIAGPTASSPEMILPNDKNQAAPIKGTGGYLTLPSEAFKKLPKDEKTIGKLSVFLAWNALIANAYGTASPYDNNDGAFIEEWDRAIDLYGSVFSGITLSLTTTSDSLPTFPQPGEPYESSVFMPVAGFESDCDDDWKTDPDDAMACAAVTQVLYYFTTTGVGGNNVKATQENGLTSRSDGSDLGPNGIKWLSATTATSASPVIGGLQFAKSFSSLTPQGKDSSDMQIEGCPNSPPTCEGMTPPLALYNVVSDSFFPGTRVAPTFGHSQTVDVNDFDYTDAPMNFLQIYSDDILYADGLSKCSMLEKTGSPFYNVKPNLKKCAAKPGTELYIDAGNTEEELELTSVNLLRISEPIP
jgi:hypothetical protein